MKTLQIVIPEDKLRAFCRHHRIARLSLFGSVLREDFTADSDVDVLVEFEPGKRLSLFGFAAIQVELSDLLGRSVDLYSPDELRDCFRDRVLSEAETLYVAPR